MFSTSSPLFLVLSHCKLAVDFQLYLDMRFSDKHSAITLAAPRIT